MDLDTAITLLLALLNSTSRVSEMIRRAREEHRDRLTAEEWTAIVAEADRSRDRLAEAIERAEGQP